MTPGQVFALFYKPAAGRADFDRVAELGAGNAERAARGEQPVIPFWHLREYRRGR